MLNFFQNVVKLLHSAGLAVKALTNQSSEGPQRGDINSKKEAFSAATSQYFSLLSSVDVNLRRQIYALEEANIIPAEAAPKDTLASQSSSIIPGAPQPKEKVAPEAGGLGSLDVGWLNSRNDKVGKEMEAELWAQMHSIMRNLDAADKVQTDKDTRVST
jgi:hypothetical protein